jgi:hypothetical protein
MFKFIIKKKTKKKLKKKKIKKKKILKKKKSCNSEDFYLKNKLIGDCCVWLQKKIENQKFEDNITKKFSIFNYKQNEIKLKYFEVK